MHILFIHCTADLYGASRVMLRSISRLIQEGHAAAVILPYSGPLENELLAVGASVHIINVDPVLRKRNLRQPFALWRDIRLGKKIYVQLAKELQIDLIVSNTSVTLLGGWVAKKIKCAHITHVRESYAQMGALARLYTSFLLQNSDRILCVSKAMALQFPHHAQDKKVCVVHDGFPIEEFESVSQERIGQFKRQFDLEDCLVVGLVGRIILQRKGQDVFVRAAALLKQRFPQVQFVIIGGCYPGNEFHLDNLERLINELGVADQVTLTGEAEDIKAAYAALDISVMASATPEPFGGVTIESMAFSKPVVGTAIGGTPEQIVEGQTGLLVPPNAPHEMAEAIGKLIEDQPLRTSMGLSARKRFENEFLFEPYYEKLSNHYVSAHEHVRRSNAV